MSDVTALTLSNPAALAAAGSAADQAAAQHVFADYRERKAARTRDMHDDDLGLFVVYLAEAGVLVNDLATTPDSWHGMTWGLVAGFVRWQIQRGYAIASVNRRLSTVKAYAKLATQAGTLDPASYALIKTVSGYSQQEGRRLDEAREQSRVGEKKAQPTSISPTQARALKRQPGSPQGCRDALLMCLLLDHGLRVGEIAGLQGEQFDLQVGTFTFYRPKVDKVQTHQLTPDTARAAAAYFAPDSGARGPLLQGSRKDASLEGTMSVRAMCERVKVLGATVGLLNLSPHDCRHYWATEAIRNGTDIKALQDAGGWASPVMPLRYAESAAIANQGVKLGS